MLKLEIITPVHNRVRETLQCLRSLARADTTGLDIHVVIVDDGSTDGTAEAVAAEFPDVEIVQGDGNLWYTAGTNRGLTAALAHDPDYILAINNDSIFHEKCIINMVNCAEKYSRSVVGAVLLNWDTPHQVFQVSPRWELSKGGFRHWNRQTVWTLPSRAWEVEIVVGNCVLYPASAIRECGLMDEKRLVHWGDAEYTPRMKKRGWRLLIEPTARVFCKPNDPASGFRSMPLRSQFDHLFRIPTSPYSLRKRLHATVGSAPSTALGLLAVPIFFIRYFLGRNQEGQWGLAADEAPLSETFAGAMVDE
ncbi:MAG: glycosyltransferase family 2 protein [Pyrinomonadaceae bacterium]|nr:glycosyltransferase family 2 protein [Pyrinomonadaceae bacterium]MBP9109040.1 glycosyltransferase family 2 protein [Pyrinomonadaceae bacterium]